jgi:hypothetical protein
MDRAQLFAKESSTIWCRHCSRKIRNPQLAKPFRYAAILGRLDAPTAAVAPANLPRCHSTLPNSCVSIGQSSRRRLPNQSRKLVTAMSSKRRCHPQAGQCDRLQNSVSRASSSRFRKRAC